LVKGIEREDTSPAVFQDRLSQPSDKLSMATALVVNFDLVKSDRLTELRRKFSSIPQDPKEFSTTMHSPPN
jgi:hypothetical protein